MTIRPPSLNVLLVAALGCGACAPLPPNPSTLYPVPVADHEKVLDAAEALLRADGFRVTRSDGAHWYSGLPPGTVEISGHRQYPDVGPSQWSSGAGKTLGVALTLAFPETHTEDVNLYFRQESPGGPHFLDTEVVCREKDAKGDWQNIPGPSGYDRESFGRRLTEACGVMVSAPRAAMPAPAPTSHTEAAATSQPRPLRSTQLFGPHANDPDAPSAR